jgi:hypothetical protein
VRGVLGSPSTADSDERFCRPGGTIGGGERGNGRGGRGLLIGAEINGHYSGLLRGLSHRRASVSSEREERKRWR